MWRLSSFWSALPADVQEEVKIASPLPQLARLRHERIKLPVMIYVERQIVNTQLAGDCAIFGPSGWTLPPRVASG